MSGNKLQVYQISLFLLWNWLVFQACIEMVSFVVGRLYFSTKSGLVQEISVPLSTSTWVSMTFIACEGTIS